MPTRHEQRQLQRDRHVLHHEIVHRARCGLSSCGMHGEEADTGDHQRTDDHDARADRAMAIKAMPTNQDELLQQQQ